MCVGRGGFQDQDIRVPSLAFFFLQLARFTTRVLLLSRRTRVDYIGNPHS